MHFQRLRIAGFKSFVEPVDVPIEPGLTGVVGPNGCGKSNLLEALRWVMGANSAKAMRGGAMDDVIFGGSTARPARNHAEVRLLIDNGDRRAPAGFNDHDAIEVVRRIDRGAGSSYRVNGAEARARDVQLLFADASTGANSPSLVRQGQISELIAAKPANRRRILEEAAGVSGLHARRHEAELKLSAAAANLDRLEDVARELDTQLSRLKREAARAEGYRRLAAEIRAVEAAALHARWREASDAHAAAETALAHAERAAGETAQAAAQANTTLLAAGEALPALREAEVTAAAVLQHLHIARDRAERAAAQAEDVRARAEADLARLAADLARETSAAEDAQAQVRRTAHELAEVETQLAAAPQRLPQFEAALFVAEGARASADGAVERLAAEAAAEQARRQAGAQRRDEAAAAACAAAARLTDARAQVGRTHAQRDALAAERAKLATTATAETGAAASDLARAEAAVAEARAALEAADRARGEARAGEAAARAAWREADDALRPLAAEAQGLARLVAAPAAGKHARALDSTTPARGFEAALAAALGDDLDAALEATAAANWSAGEAVAAHPPPWPRGAEPLAAHLEAPPHLRARLALTALVAREDGARLQRLVPIGARLVSREGDLWRWDGLTVAASAPRPAAVRLAQRARLAEVEAEAARLTPERDALAATHRRTEAAVQEAEAAFARLRPAPAQAERTLAAAREAAERQARDAALREARLAALAESIAAAEAELARQEDALPSVQAEADAAAARLAAAGRDAQGAASPADLAALDAARAEAARAREAEARARSALDGERRAREGRQRRREALAREAADWSRRADAATARAGALAAEVEPARTARDAALEAPAALTERLARTADEVAAAEARRRAAGDALAQAETARTEADRALRTAETAAAAARERRAGDAARRESAAARMGETLEAIRSQAGVEPQALAARVAASATAVPSDPAALEAHLRALLARRDSLGPVNLQAADEAAEAAARLDAMDRERTDLAQAIVKLRTGVEALNAEGRERLLAAFSEVDQNFQALFKALFDGGEAELRLVESPDPLEAGLEIYACPPGKRLSTMSLMSGGEQALTATALIFAVFLANPSPVCVLDEVDAPLDDANVDRFCRLLDEMRRRTATRFIAITHNPVTMSRMDRLFGVTMAERGVSQLVSVDLARAEALAAQ